MNRKGITNISKMRPQSIPSSIKHRCENDDRTSDAKMMENGANMDSQSEPTSRNRCPKYKHETVSKYGSKKGHVGATAGKWDGGGGRSNTD